MKGMTMSRPYSSAAGVEEIWIAMDGDVDVLIAASRKDRVQDRQGLAEAAGLTPVVLDIESHASRMAMQRVMAGMPEAGKDSLEIGRAHV